MSATEIVAQLNNAYDEAVRDLPLEDAIEVAEEHGSYVDGALAGLRADQDAAA